MLFNYDFDIISLLFLTILAVRFYTQKQFPLLSNRIFGRFILLGVAYNALDIFGTVLLETGSPLLIRLAFVINTLYYITTIGMPAALTVYLVALMSNTIPVKRRTYIFFNLPALLIIAAFLVALPLGMVFRISPTGEYSYGPLSFITYLCFVVYLPLDVWLLLAKRRYFKKAERVSVWVLLVMLIGTTCVQYFNHTLLLTGSGLAASIIIMYFTLQDPHMLADKDTDLFNSAALQQLLHTRDNEQKSYAVIGMDLHDLHSYYMLYGRASGDKILREVSGYIKTEKQAWSFRVADAQFVSIVKNDDAENFITDLSQKLKRPIRLEDVNVTPEISVFCLKNAEQAGTSETVMKVIEAAFSEHEELAGKNETVWFDANQIKALTRKAGIEQLLRKSIPAGENFRMYYQPIYSLKEGRYRAMEALLRFNCEEFGRLSPGEFMPIIEKKGLSTQLDEMVVEKVFSQIDSGAFRKLRLDCVHINLSPASFASEHTTARILDLAKRYDIDPKFVIFEITENAANITDDMLRHCVDRLRQGGFGIALDDFGTGYSNLARLLSIPFSYVKLDKSLIQDSASIIADLTRVFSRFTVGLIAEGVETEDQVDLVRQAGIGEIQGFYYARPMPVDDVRMFLVGNSKN